MFLPLAEAVLRHFLDNLVAVLFLGVNPASGLVHGQWVGRKGREELIDLNHCLADGGSALVEFGDELGVVEDAAWHLSTQRRTSLK